MDHAVVQRSNNPTCSTPLTEWIDHYSPKLMQVLKAQFHVTQRTCDKHGD
jgi:hypothetical protein